MGFWKYCEKIEMCIGIKYTLDYIHDVRKYWFNNITVGECVNRIQAKIKSDKQDKNYA